MKSCITACDLKNLFRSLIPTLRTILLCSGLCLPGFVLGKSQIVSFYINTTHFYPSESFEVAVVYESSDRGLATGMGIRVHYDSSQISIDSITKVLSQGQVGIQTKQDTADYDNDPATDYYITAGWADVNGAWPETVSQPTQLLQLAATTVANFSGTRLNLTIASRDSSYVALGDALHLTSTIGD